MINLQKQRGATLMEVLITMVIVLFGLVGLSQLFLKAQRTTLEAYDRHRALALANQMAEMTRTMMRSTDTLGAVGGVFSCPAAGAMPSNGILSNEQLMSCFDELSKGSGGEGHLGRLVNETDISEPEALKSTLSDCTLPNGCDSRKMAMYVLNNWTESLAGYSQRVSGGTGDVFTNKGFAARGCIDRICNFRGRKTGCGTNPLLNTYRIRVYWISDDPIARDEAYHYCDDTEINEYFRYTFVDVSIPTPSSLSSQ